MRNDFAIFILTYGRPNNQKTLNTLKKLKVKYPIYLVCSDDDPTLEEYQEKYKDKVIVFNKDQAVQEMGIDLMDNFGNKKAIIYARNYNFVIAEKLGYRYFWQLDDDYCEFSIPDFNSQKWFYLCSNKWEKLDLLLEKTIEFYKKNPKILGLSFSQGGDFLGGITKDKMRVKRKCMNSFFCDTQRPFLFRGTINEDVNFYSGNGARDGICMQIHNIKLNQEQTQKSSGGMTDSYLNDGTYVKSFYSIIGNPIAVKIGVMGDNHLRLHHTINYNKVAPKIIKENYKK